MISRYDVTLNGTSLSAINESILITDIRYNAAKFSDETYNVSKRHGSRIWRRMFKSASVKIEFAIRAYSTSERQSVCAAIINWAKDGGELRCNDRPGQRLRCVCTEFPYVDSVRGWTDTLSITFTAYALPFWEEAVPVTASLTSDNNNKYANLYIPGNIDYALVEATVTTAEAFTTSDSIIFGTMTFPEPYTDFTTMTLTGKALASSKKVKLSYDDQMVQTIIYNGSTSMIPYRTGDTDLLVPCGKTFRLKYKSTGESTVEYSVRGLWL